MWKFTSVLGFCCSPGTIDAYYTLEVVSEKPTASTKPRVIIQALQTKMSSTTTMRQTSLAQVSALRGVLSRLALLFFLAHPGSAATFGDTKHFLLSRYPNRDVVPSGLRPAAGRRRADEDTVSSLLFVTPFPVSRPSPNPVTPCLQQQLFSSSWALSKLLDNQSPAGLTTAINKPHPAVNRAISPARGRPCRVVVGDFVSSLERRTEAGARRRAMLDFASSPAPTPAYPTLLDSKLSDETDEISLPVVDGAGVLMSSSAAGEQEESRSPLGIRGGIMNTPNLGTEFWKKSTAPIFDAYDNVVSFVGSKLVTSSLNKMIGGARDEAAASRKRGRDVADAMTNGLRLSELNSASSSLRYDLVGFIDVDPFEKSRRHFKRNNGKVLL